MRINFCCAPRHPRKASSAKLRLQAKPKPKPQIPPRNENAGMAPMQVQQPTRVQIGAAGKQLFQLMAPQEYDKGNKGRSTVTSGQLASLAEKMSPSEQAAVLRDLRRKNVSFNESMCDGAIATLIKKAADPTQNFDGVRLSLFFGLAACADTRVKSGEDAEILLPAPPQPAPLPETSLAKADESISSKSSAPAANVPQNMKEAAYTLALACRIPVELLLQRYDTQIKRQQHLKHGGAALNIVAGTFPWTGGAGTLAEKGTNRLAEKIFNTDKLRWNAVLGAVQDHCKLVAGSFEINCPDDRKDQAALYSSAFTTHFKNAWETMGLHSNDLREFDGANIELGFSV